MRALGNQVEEVEVESGSVGAPISGGEPGDDLLMGSLLQGPHWDLRAWGPVTGKTPFHVRSQEAPPERHHSHMYLVCSRCCLSLGLFFQTLSQPIAAKTVIAAVKPTKWPGAQTRKEKAKWDPGGVLLGVDPAGPCGASRELGSWGIGGVGQGAQLAI